MNRKMIVCWWLLVMAAGAKGQQDSLRFRNEEGKPPPVASIVVPAVFTAYGFAALKWQALKDWDNTVQRNIYADHPHKPFHLDNYLQFGPGLAVYGLNAAGVHGRHNLRDRTAIYVVANA